MSASDPKPSTWWFPKRGAGVWKVQITPERTDFGLCINVLNGQQKQWVDLKRELYGDSWDEIVAEAIEHGRPVK